MSGTISLCMSHRTPKYNFKHAERNASENCPAKKLLKASKISKGMLQIMSNKTAT